MANNYDRLGLLTNLEVQKMLNKLGDNLPKPEKVVLSINIIKINKRRKEQDRILLITNKAIYNLKPKDFSKCQRRIGLDKLSITTSKKSSEFAIHVTGEYDYRYKSEYKDHICKVLSDLYLKSTKKKLTINSTDNSDISSVIITKDVAKFQTREQRLLCYHKLIGIDGYDDDDDDDDEVQDTKQEIIGRSINTNENVLIEDFEFLKVIGRGSFGKVIQVRKKDTGEIYAMKILKKKALIARHQVEHTKSERNILQQLQHPFLMHLRYALQTDSKLYFVLDYYRGGELFFHLKKKSQFTETEAQFFVAESTLALGYLHSLDIIYRDLKPENILLDQTGHICLTDFGLSKDLSPNNHEAYTFCGTPEYLSPETLTNLGYNKTVDWWSLGILLYELIVGIPPFYSQNINEMYRKIQESPLIFPPNLSNLCKDLIKKLLERDPKMRLGSGEEDVEEIKSHIFFKNIDWKALYKKEIDPPYKPQVKGFDDTSNFDNTFLNEQVVDSYALPPTLENNQDDGFGGFTYIPKEINEDDE